MVVSDVTATCTVAEYMRDACLTPGKLSQDVGRFPLTAAKMTTMVPHVMLVLFLVCGAGLAQGNPVLANPYIIQFLPLQDRCLFICNICFDKQIPLMGVCANTVCPKISKSFFEVNQWISKRCQNYESLQAAFFPQDTQVQL
ncbi:uncharacterized protein LOC110446828 [Mizuhopecten yessoensis]|uniref:uncharacterized protein LOC110446828 n=1 Tax=Mizuhopecten yessoensis TaxID=6573 RepID=UPI000B4592CF|nr:uncharacterized protein LOC110446828 [Mizuhopecten yessoensis]